MSTNTSNSNSKSGHMAVYQKVTMQILDNMMKGELPWRKTYVAKKGQKAPFTNYVTGKPYSFINSLLLGEPGEYASFKQIKAAGGNIKKGAKSKMVIYWGEFIPAEYKEKAEELEKEGKSTDHLKVRFPKYYLVFNVKDAEGLKEKKSDEETVVMQEAEAPTALARMVIDEYGINQKVSVKSNPTYQPCYLPEEDTVQVPEKENYFIEEDWYASVFSGLVHSTATEERCNRETELKKMLDGNMSVKEELIAEIGSSMILNVCGLDRQETATQQAAECQKWIAALNNDYRLIVTASNAAEKAAKMVLGAYAA